MTSKPIASSRFGLSRTWLVRCRRVDSCPMCPCQEIARDERRRYVNSGSFYVLRVSQTIDRGSFFGSVISGFVLTRPEMEIDIDRPEQLAMARGLAEHFHDDLFSYGLIVQRSE